MNINSSNKENLNLLRKISKQNKITQRKLAKDLGISLGKLNYCLKRLIEKGMIKIDNFHKNSNKSNYLYILTHKGIKEKTKLTFDYMKRISKEYDELKRDLR